MANYNLWEFSIESLKINNATPEKLQDNATSKAEKAGLLVVKVDPRGTSQHCCKCFNRVSKELNDRWHLCPNCGLSLDRDLNSAILIQKVGLDTALLKNAQSSKLKKEKPTL